MCCELLNNLMLDYYFTDFFVSAHTCTHLVLSHGSAPFDVDYITFIETTDANRCLRINTDWEVRSTASAYFRV